MPHLRYATHMSFHLQSRRRVAFCGALIALAAKQEPRDLEAVIERLATVGAEETPNIEGER